MQIRASLSDDVEAEVRRLIARGDLTAGERINEVHLARALSISRTPLREALGRLTGEALVEVRPRHGFYVRPLSAAEVREIYPIRARLDPWALELAGLPGAERRVELIELNERLREAVGDPEDMIELDDAWHLALVRPCGNPTLLAMIRSMMWRTRRYEFAYFSRAEHGEAAVREHAEVIAALERGDLAGACTRLERNLTRAIPELVRRIEAEAQA